MPVQFRDPGPRIPSRGRCFVYVAPCAWEDLLKLGHSRDPLERLQALHPRWYEFFDLDRGLLVETDTVREARDLELTLARGIVEHNAPVPLVIRREAAGHGEWYRGAWDGVARQVATLRDEGWPVHAPLRSWLRAALAARGDLLFDWTTAVLGPDDFDAPRCDTPRQRAVRDVLDAWPALELPLAPLLPERVAAWHRAVSGR